MAALSSVSTYGELALPAVGAYQEGMAISKAADYNAANAENNANLSRAEGAENERKQRIIGKKALGSIRSAYGASGVSSSEGSAMEILEESAGNAELDALNVRHQGEMKARGYDQEASLERFKSKQAKQGAYIGGATKFFEGFNKFQERLGSMTSGGMAGGAKGKGK